MVDMYRNFRGAFCLQFRVEVRDSLFILNLGMYLSPRGCHISEYSKVIPYRPGVAQRVGRGIAPLLHDRGTRRR